MLHLILILACAVFVTVHAKCTMKLNTEFNATIHKNPDTVDSLDVNAYLGLWYQMAADAIVMSTFEKDGYCVTAKYGDNGDGTISVHNYATIGSPSDSITNVIDGYAYQTDPTKEPGQLAVVFNSDDAAPFPAPYWILELGPINENGLYDYAIVSDSFSLYLFVLARDVVTYNAKYKASVSNTLTKLGFTGASAPIDTYQGSDCVYESTKRATKKKELSLTQKLDTVDSLDIPSYLGLWYQMASDAIVLETFEKDAYCATALYGDNGDGTISVHNYADIGSATGMVYTIDGYGWQSNPNEEPGQLLVVLEGPDASPYPAPYWIIELGPINNNMYDYAIVSDNLASTLFVLARDPVIYNVKYKTSVSKTLEDLGFIGRKQPIDIYQGSDCVYESTRRSIDIKSIKTNIIKN